MVWAVFALTPAKPGNARRPSFQAGVADADGPCRLRADEGSGRLSFGLAGWRALCWGLLSTSLYGAVATGYWLICLWFRSFT